MSSFFTTPASQRKRKRGDANSTAESKRPRSQKAPGAKSRKAREDSISSGDSEDGNIAQNISADEGSSSDEHEDETAAERRLRLAEQYLENVREAVIEAPGFDAKDIDRDLIAERLQEDVAETKGKVYRHIAEDFDLDVKPSNHVHFRTNQSNITAVSVCAPYAYTASKDMRIVKWELPSALTLDSNAAHPSNKTPPTRPRQVASARGSRAHKKDAKYVGHTDQILCIAASPLGKRLASGDAAGRIVVWDVETPNRLKALRVLSYHSHRDAVTSLAFGRKSNQMYSSSKDRTIKVWDLTEMVYIETLFGHQDGVLDVAALSGERCISVGGRDRTARLWKVVEQEQLVFRGGGDDMVGGLENVKAQPPPHEGTLDRLALLDDNHWITGSDNGTLSLWSVHKKKPLFTIPYAHGFDPPLSPEEASAEQNLSDVKLPNVRNPRYITALAAVPFSDFVVSGSWDGVVRLWKVGGDLRNLQVVGELRIEKGKAVNGGGNMETDESKDVNGGVETDGAKNMRPHVGIINDLSIYEKGDRGKDGVVIVAGVARELRLGKWKVVKNARQGCVMWEVKRKSAVTSEDEDDASEDGEDGEDRVEENGSGIENAKTTEQAE
ncbi:WD40 repeat-like protein [Aulographum hederae CBS 113979]|uniref:WD40 repeat-like protein n=1 Tax=Aulographum hederae CBS 113979 TaxID=1176131 RepID=A0A6G1GJF9_9PEZI|nr:WD40 repeat-like protein [Aulographum hederae CBS 113979]